MFKQDAVEGEGTHALPNTENVKARKTKKKVYRPSDEYKSQKSSDQIPEKREKPKPTQVFFVELLYLLIKIAAIILAFMLMFTFVFGIYRTADPAMAPAIKDGDLVLFYRLDKEYIPSDTMVLEYDGEKQVRRVVAVAGDEVDIREDGLYINGSRQQESLIYEDTQRFDTGVEFPLTVQRGEVFVLGDSRTVATDSRFYGVVNIDYALGKVMTVIRRRGI